MNAVHASALCLPSSEKSTAGTIFFTRYRITTGYKKTQHACVVVWMSPECSFYPKTFCSICDISISYNCLGERSRLADCPHTPRTHFSPGQSPDRLCWHSSMSPARKHQGLSPLHLYERTPTLPSPLIQEDRTWNSMAVMWPETTPGYRDAERQDRRCSNSSRL